MVGSGRAVPAACDGKPGRENLRVGRTRLLGVVTWAGLSGQLQYAGDEIHGLPR